MSSGTALGMYHAAACAVWARCASWIGVVALLVFGLCIHSQYCSTSSGFIVILGVIRGVFLVYICWHFGVGKDNFWGHGGRKISFLALLGLTDDCINFLSFSGPGTVESISAIFSSIGAILRESRPFLCFGVCFEVFSGPFTRLILLTGVIYLQIFGRRLL